MKKLTLIFWLIFIFIMSSMDASSSSRLSKYIADIFFMNELLIRKFAHALEFFILGLLVFRITKGNIVSILFPMMFAFFDEVHQFFVPGRFMFYGDVIIDFTGIICAFILYKYYYKQYALAS